MPKRAQFLSQNGYCHILCLLRTKLIFLAQNICSQINSIGCSHRVLDAELLPVYKLFPVWLIIIYQQHWMQAYILQNWMQVLDADKLLQALDVAAISASKDSQVPAIIRIKQIYAGIFAAELNASFGCRLIFASFTCGIIPCNYRNKLKEMKHIFSQTKWKFWIHTHCYGSCISISSSITQ